MNINSNNINNMFNLNKNFIFNNPVNGDITNIPLSNHNVFNETLFKNFQFPLIPILKNNSNSSNINNIFNNNSTFSFFPFYLLDKCNNKNIFLSNNNEKSDINLLNRKRFNKDS